MQASASERALVAASRFIPPHVVRTSKLRFAGALDAFTVEDALWRIQAIVDKEPDQVIVDLQHLDLIDSTGVQALLSLHKRVTALGGKVTVVNAHDQPLMVLELLRLDRVLFARE